MTTNLPHTAVLVLNFNGRQHLEACFESLLALEGVPGPDLWLVDNASTDGSTELVAERFPTVRVLRFDRNLGFPGAYNRAIDATDAPWIALLNNDTRVAPDWLAQLHAARERHPDAWALASRMLSWNGDRIDFDGADTFFFGHALQHDVGAPVRNTTPDERPLLFGCAGSLLLRRETFLTVGGFDGTYFSFIEDVDLGWRANILGHATWFVPQALTYHRLHASWGDAITPRKRLLLERNALCNVIKNYEPSRAPVLLLVSAALAFLRGWWAGYESGPTARLTVTTDLLCHLLAIAAVADRLPDLLATNAWIQSRRQRADRDLFPLFGALASPPLPSSPEYRRDFAAACSAVGATPAGDIASWDDATNAAALEAFAALADACELGTRHRANEATLGTLDDLAIPHRLPFAISSMLAETAAALELAVLGPPSSERLRELRDRLRSARPNLIEGFGGYVSADRATAPTDLAVRQDEFHASAPTITVIIRTQDRPQFLRRAIASVGRQTRAANEILVVCDGGPDPSAILTEFPELPLRPVLIAGAKGRSGAAQRGLEEARGAFVCFLDDDDQLAPDHLEVLAAGIRTSGLPVAYTDVECVVVGGDGLDGPVEARSVFADDFDPVRLLFENTIPFMAVLMDRALALEVGGFDPTLEYFEDWDLWLRLAQRTPFHHCRRVTATYYVRPALGHGLATGGDHRWRRMARLIDRHSNRISGAAWVEYYRSYVEPCRQDLAQLGRRLSAAEEETAELRQALAQIRASRSWRWTAWLRRLLGRG